MVLKELIFNRLLHLERCGGLDSTDFFNSF